MGVALCVGFLFFARKQIGDILKEGVTKSLRVFCVSISRSIWELGGCVPSHQAGLFSWRLGCVCAEAVGARMLYVCPNTGSPQPCPGPLTAEGTRRRHTGDGSWVCERLFKTRRV